MKSVTINNKSLSSLIRSLGMDENKTIIMSNEDILISNGNTIASFNSHYQYEQVVKAMDAARMDERERTINELVEWMEGQHEFLKGANAGINDKHTEGRVIQIGYCITHAKSLLNNPVKKEGEEQTS